MITDLDVLHEELSGLEYDHMKSKENIQYMKIQIGWLRDNIVEERVKAQKIKLEILKKKRKIKRYEETTGTTKN